MSPSWREQVRLVLCPDRLIAVRLARGWRRGVLFHQSFPVAAAADADPQAVLARLAEVLAQPNWQHADAVVLVSSRFASYQLLPWTDVVLDEEEEAARARHAFTRSHGEAAAALELRRSPGGWGAASVVSAVDKALLAGIRDTVAASTLRLVSVQPYLMAAFNQCRPILLREPHWFAVVESGTLCTALLDCGRWVSLRMRRIAGDWPGELQLALRRQGLADGVSEPTSVLIHAADEPESLCPAQPGWSFRRLQLPAPPDVLPGRDRPYSLALAGAY